MIQLKELKQVYKINLKKNKESFKFKGLEFLTSYVKYLLDYFESLKIEDEIYIEIKPQI